MSRRAYIACFSSGLGHASRMAEVGLRLKIRNIDLVYSASNEAEALLKSQGFSVITAPRIDVQWDDNIGGLSLRRTFFNFPLMVETFLKQIAHEVKSLRSFRPRVVISDSRLSSVLAAYLLNIPCITVLNQLNLLLDTTRYRMLARLFERSNAKILGRLWSFSEDILVPDLPPPNTIGLHSLSGLKNGDHKVSFIGFMHAVPAIDRDKIGYLVEELKLDHGRPIVFFQISGPPPTKTPLFEKVYALRDYQKFHSILSKGNPSGKAEPKRYGNLWVYDWCHVRDEFFSLADVVVLRGGHSSISRAVMFGKPMLCIPIKGHGEQLGNARRVEELGIGISLRQETLDEKIIIDAINNLVNDSSYRQNVEKLRRISESLEGVSAVTDRATKIFN